MPNLTKIETIKALDAVAKSGINANNIKEQFERTFAIAEATQELSNMLTPQLMQPIMQLQGRKLGFRTDRRYSEAEVQDCLIEATLQGVYPVGNQFNIIAGQCYITKEGFGKKLKDISGLSWLITPGVPKLHGDKGATIEMEVSWIYNGKSDKKTLPICVRFNSKTTGTDAIIGKAERKARAWLFQNITGQEVVDGEVEADHINVTSKPVYNSKVQESNLAADFEKANGDLI
ncbi:hypothetical protein P0136_10560 [Lentisphaerota bacterium ZTH]|nr:hypothetical protein JYG24_11925 [Lentisphaerota bacterium]WET05802.1 hypothetical protein P0136_10560 [Lentisphaerota bacterium ZTH]